MTDYQTLTQQIASQEGINPNLFLAQIKQESGFNPNALSPAGAEGIAQFMPSTAAGLGVNPWDPAQSLRAAADLMRSYIAKFGGWPQALAAYNAGPGSLSSSGEISGNPNWQSNLPAETQNYIQTIMNAGGGAVQDATQMFNLPSCQQSPSSWWCFPVTQAYGVPEGNKFVGGIHAGIDIGVPLGTQITAIEPGTIVAAGPKAWGGDVLEAVQQGGQTVYEQFLHLEQINVTPGEQIQPGQLLGLSGGTSTASPIPTSGGYSSGPHVHFAEYATGLPEQWGFANTIDPTQLISQLGKGMSVSGGTVDTSQLGYNTGSSSGDCAAKGYVPIFQIPQIGPIGGGNICLPLTVQQTQQGLIRTGLVIAGVIIVLIGFFALVGRPKINVNIPQGNAPAEESSQDSEEAEEEAGPTEEEAKVI